VVLKPTDERMITLPVSPRPTHADTITIGGHIESPVPIGVASAHLTSERFDVFGEAFGGEGPALRFPWALLDFAKAIWSTSLAHLKANVFSVAGRSTGFL
jgi:hypothetical protein